MLRDDAIEIWKAGVAAVDSGTLVQQNLAIDDGCLIICGNRISLNTCRNIEVVGAGKAGAGMARAVEAIFAEPTNAPHVSNVNLNGWVNVPEDCVGDCGSIHLHGARPAGINEPTEAGVTGTREIIRRISSLHKDDICLVLISGGGSALLPAPVEGISLADKLHVTRILARAGAAIEELNVVRSQLSSIKGGGLLQNCSAGQVVALVISDVTGDPLEFIASGPTVPRNSTPADALAVLKHYDPTGKLVPASVYSRLQSAPPRPTLRTSLQFQNHIVGANKVAVNAAATKAAELGYEVISLGSTNCGNARQHGIALMKRLSSLRNLSSSSSKTCVLAGGETTVKLAETSAARKGGRNQEVVLAAIAEFAESEQWKNITLLSGGTDGEDGPTDAAGAFADEQIVAEISNQQLCINDYQSINNAYPILNNIGALLKTGPTHTNVMDLAVGLTGS